jgi:predicted transcriptional regulator
MDRRSIPITFLLLSLAVSASVIFGEEGMVGTQAHSFKVVSGDDAAMTLEMTAGKTTVIFYETKDVVEKNRELKNRLNNFYFEQPDAVKKLIVRLPIVNCRDAFWPFTGIWRNKLKEHSRKEGMVIYGDWDGDMLVDFRLKDKESNAVIIDKKGMIKYFASGKIEGEEIAGIERLLERLQHE